MSTAATPASGTDVAAPPLGWLVLYRALGLRLPERYRPWVARDIARDGWFRRQLIGTVAVYGAMVLPWAFLRGASPTFVLVWTGLVIGSLVHFGHRDVLRRAAYAHQKVHPDGSPWPDAPRLHALHESLRPKPWQWAAFFVFVAALVVGGVAFWLSSSAG